MCNVDEYHSVEAKQKNICMFLAGSLNMQCRYCTIRVHITFRVLAASELKSSTQLSEPENRKQIILFSM